MHILQHLFCTYMFKVIKNLINIHNPHLSLIKYLILLKNRPKTNTSTWFNYQNIIVLGRHEEMLIHYSLT